MEGGATGITLLLVTELTEFTFVKRAFHGEGIDYWLGYKDDIMFQEKSRLEISGILEGSLGQVRSRVREKLAQTKPTDTRGYSVYIAVVEFSALLAHVVKKDG